MKGRENCIQAFHPDFVRDPTGKGKKEILHQGGSKRGRDVSQELYINHKSPTKKRAVLEARDDFFNTFNQKERGKVC